MHGASGIRITDVMERDTTMENKLSPLGITIELQSSGILWYFFALEGETVHALCTPTGTREVSLSQARDLIRQAGVKITPRQAEVLGIEVHNG